MAAARNCCLLAPCSNSCLSQRQRLPLLTSRLLGRRVKRGRGCSRALGAMNSSLSCRCWGCLFCCEPLFAWLRCWLLVVGSFLLLSCPLLFQLPGCRAACMQRGVELLRRLEHRCMRRVWVTSRLSSSGLRC